MTDEQSVLQSDRGRVRCDRKGGRQRGRIEKTEGGKRSAATHLKICAKLCKGGIICRARSYILGMDALRTFPPPEGVYKCASVYKPIKSRVSCVTSVYISVYKGDDMEERSSKSEMQREIFAGGKSGDPRRYE